MIHLSAFSDEAGAGLQEQIAALKRNGISLMEIRNVDGINVQKLTLEQAEAIQAELEKSLHRSQIIMDQTDSIVFDWDLEHGALHLPKSGKGSRRDLDC